MVFNYLIEHDEVVAEHIGNPKDGWVQSNTQIDAIKMKYDSINKLWVNRPVIVVEEPEVDPELPLVPVKSFSELQDERCSIINGWRDSLEKEPIFFKDAYFDFDDTSRERLSWAGKAAEKATKLGIPFYVEWTCYDNSTITLTADDFDALPLLIAQRADAIHKKSRILKQMICATTTKEELEEITWDSL